MSYMEAKTAGIPIGKLPNGMTAYYPPCYKCGTQVLSVTYNPSKEYTCADCRRLISILERTEKKIEKLECADVPKKVCT